MDRTLLRAEYPGHPFDPNLGPDHVIRRPLVQVWARPAHLPEGYTVLLVDVESEGYDRPIDLPHRRHFDT